MFCVVHLQAYDARKQLPMMPTGAVWKPFPSVHIPNGYSTHKAREFLEASPEVRFSYEEGVVLAVEKERDSDEEDLFDFSQPTQQDRKRLFVDGTWKCANCFIDSGRVMSILDCQRDTHYFVKAQVQASMAKKFYVVQIMIAKASGKICFTECKCKARALCRCCHIMSVLLLIGRHVLNKGHEGNLIYLLTFAWASLILETFRGRNSDLSFCIMHIPFSMDLIMLSN